MHRLSYFVMFAGYAVLANNAYEICKKCNVSYVLSRQYDATQNSYRLRPSVPLVRDVSYLQEDYVAEQEEKQVDQQPLDRDNRNLSPEYRNLCETVTKKVQLDDSEYEYQPPHYHEIYCKSYSFLGDNQHAVTSSKQKCVLPGFHCVQKGRTLLLIRRRWNSECWEPFVKEIASGCDCMWPVSILGDITEHYSV